MMIKRISIYGLMVLFSIFIMFIWGCGKDTPTEPVIQPATNPTTNAQGEISTPDSTQPKTSGVGRVGETLSNNYYRVTLKEIDRYANIVVEIENTGNKDASYVGPFNFSVITADSQVYATGPNEGIKLNIGQKKEFDFTIEPEKTRWAFLEEGSLFIFQAYTDIIPAGEKNDLFLPKGKTIGKPIVFNPHLFVPKVVAVNPEPENGILSTGTIKISFSSLIDEKSIEGISMTGGKVIATSRLGGDTYGNAVFVILQNIAPGPQTIDVSMVTDQAGERLSGVTTFKFFVKPDQVPPTIVGSKIGFDSIPTTGLSGLKPELCKSISITFSEPMNTGATKAIIDPPINGRNQLTIDWQIRNVEVYLQGMTYPIITSFATVQLNQALACSTKYTLIIQGEDLAGNKIEDKIVFETYTPDITPPEIAGDQCGPKNGAEGIDPLNVQKIVIVFSEAMSEANIESLEPKGMDNRIIPDTFYGGNRLTISILGGGMLSNEMNFIATLSGKDLAGNPLKTTQYSFWTMRVIGGFANLPMQETLALYLPFDEGHGIIAGDGSGNKNDGKLQGIPTSIWYDGKYGKAIRFKDVKDMLVVRDGSTLDITQQITISVWVSVSSMADKQCAIISKDGAYILQMTNQGNGFGVSLLLWPLGNSQTSTGTIIKFSSLKWHHIAAIYDEKEIKIYIDGALSNTEKRTGLVDTTNTDLIVGRDSRDEYKSMKADIIIDELTIWSQALSEDRIKKYLYDSPLDRYLR